MRKEDIWRRFDYKALCLFTGYKDREHSVSAELERVGLSDAERLWQIPSPFDNVLLRNVVGRLGVRPGFFNCGMGHYRAIKTAYELGAEHSLIMEDDIRFLKDIDLLSEIVSDIPDDYDIALLDAFKPKSMSNDEWVGLKRRRRASRYWCGFYNARSFACYSMSRKGMERWIGAWENAFINRSVLRVCDQYLRVDRLGADLNMYMAIINAGIQGDVGGSACSGRSGCHIDKYIECGMDPKLYAP